MDALAELITAVAALAWPLVFAVLLYKLFDPIRILVESAKARKFTIKVAGNELTMEEASQQQRAIVSDLQTKIAEIEKRSAAGVSTSLLSLAEPPRSDKRILWVDDKPKNNSFLAAALEDRGAKVETALSTDEAIALVRKKTYDIIISDMERPEGDRAGLDLTRRLKELGVRAPVYIFCGAWGAKHLRKDALQAGVAEITSSGTTLLGSLPLAEES